MEWVDSYSQLFFFMYLEVVAFHPPAMISCLLGALRLCFDGAWVAAADEDTFDVRV